MNIVPTPHKSLQHPPPAGDEFTDDESGYDSSADDLETDCTLLHLLSYPFFGLNA